MTPSTIWFMSVHLWWRIVWSLISGATDLASHWNISPDTCSSRRSFLFWKSSSRMYDQMVSVIPSSLPLWQILLQEPVLQATQYIPDIVRLQKQLFDELHHRINHKVAHTVSIHDFILRQHTSMSVFFKAVDVTTLHFFRECTESVSGNGIQCTKRLGSCPRPIEGSWWLNALPIMK